MKKSHFDKIGIKQVIRIEWMDRCLSLLLAGMTPEQIRIDLTHFLADKKQSGGIEDRGKKTYPIAISILAVWFDPAKELLDFRNHLLDIAQKLPQNDWLPLHWAIMIANYPFWYNVAIKAGRLLALQEKITQKQVFDRVVEQYGQRSTVLRNARYTVRSFIAWGIMQDTDIKGKYCKSDPIPIANKDIIEALLEAILISTPDHKALLQTLLSSPALFPLCIATDVAFSITTNNNEYLTSEKLGNDILMVAISHFSL